MSLLQSNSVISTGTDSHSQSATLFAVWHSDSTKLARAPSIAIAAQAPITKPAWKSPCIIVSIQFCYFSICELDTCFVEIIALIRHGVTLAVSTATLVVLVSQPEAVASDPKSFKNVV